MVLLSNTVWYKKKQNKSQHKRVHIQRGIRNRKHDIQLTILLWNYSHSVFIKRLCHKKWDKLQVQHDIPSYITVFNTFPEYVTAVRFARNSIYR